MSENYVVVGAGIVGLYTAFSLIEKGVSAKQITVKAQHLPGDQSIDYTSPWAGGNFSCISGSDPDSLKYDKFTYTSLYRVQEKLGGAKCGLDRLPIREYFDQEPAKVKTASLRTYLEAYRVLAKHELAPRKAYGIEFITWNFNCPLFLDNMQKYLEAQGVTFKRLTLAKISEAYTANTKVVFNCTGIGAHKLAGVADSKVYPTRGAVLVVKAPHIKANRMSWGENSATYVIPRPYSGDHVILGGYVQKDNWTADTFEYEVEDIIKRTTELFPALAEAPFQIVRQAAGLRPSRHGGVRIERETLEDGKLLIHNYGASGYGYQSGFGMANRATELFFERESKL